MKRKSSLLAHACFAFTLTTLLAAHANNQTPPTLVGSARCDDQCRVQRRNAFAGDMLHSESVPALLGPGSSQRNDPTGGSSANQSAPIPMDQLGAVAGKQYQGDGLSVIATTDGASLRCAFQRLEGQVTREGLWLSSTTDNNSGERFRVMAMEVGRVTPCAPFQDWLRPGAHGVTRPTSMIPTLACSGIVNVADNVARFIRPGLTEEYTVSVDGVRQDFIIEQRPEGDGELRVELDVTGAKAEPLVNGARLVLDGSGRKLAYNRLRVTDAAGRELPARMEVASGILPDVEGAHPAARNSAPNNSKSNLRAMSDSAGLEAAALRQARMPAATMLAVLVDDAAAIYPVRIDPTFSDADWSGMGGILGANGVVYATAVDSSGNLYIGGNFTVVGGVIANNIAKWNGSNWSALGSGITVRPYLPLLSFGGRVLAIAVSGSNVYAGGILTSAGGIAVKGVAKWNGAYWSALGSEMIEEVYALAVSGEDLYAGGFTPIYSFECAVCRYSCMHSPDSTPEERAACQANCDAYKCRPQVPHFVAKWNGFDWSSMASETNGRVYALAVAGGDIYAGGGFTNIGGTAASYIAKWNGSGWNALGSGMNGSVLALAVSGSHVYAGGGFTTAGGSAATNVAKWNGSNWSVLGLGMGGVTSPYVYALAVSGSDLYAGGVFTTAGGVAANQIAKWNGSTWSALGSGINNTVRALITHDTNLYAGGDFTTAGTNSAVHIAKANINALASPGRFTNLVHSTNTGFSCTFLDATIGQPYRIQTSPSLAAGSWTDFTNFTYTAPIAITVPIAGNTNRFFRAITP